MMNNQIVWVDIAAGNLHRAVKFYSALLGEDVIKQSFSGVTIGIPAFFYRRYFRAHSLKNLERNILSFCDIGPVRTNIIGMIEGDSAVKLRAPAGLTR